MQYWQWHTENQCDTVIGCSCSVTRNLPHQARSSEATADTAQGGILTSRWYWA